MNDPKLFSTGSRASISPYGTSVILSIGSFSKPRRRRRRERHQTKDLMSRTIAVHVRFES